ncbi:hypothetical protein D1007_34580 [Hordeum vulgare]|nr:hypothetical protein D1007_34580 [Hordeum vulgare]
MHRPARLPRGKSLQRTTASRQAETNEQAMKVWRRRFSRDFIDGREFWTRRRAVRATKWAERRERKATTLVQCDLGKASTWIDNDDCRDDAFLASDYTIEESGEE